MSRFKYYSDMRKLIDLRSIEPINHNYFIYLMPITEKKWEAFTQCAHIHLVIYKIVEHTHKL